jgi:hypothetical protein
MTLPPLVAAGATAAALLAVPAAVAESMPPVERCAESGGTITCLSPGNVEICSYAAYPSFRGQCSGNRTMQMGDRHRHHRWEARLYNPRP